MEPRRMEMKPARERIRDRLGLVVKIEASEITPARVAAQLDQTRAQHNAKAQPAKQPQDEHRRWALRKRTAVEQRAKKHGKESDFQELYFPAIGVPVLPD